MVAATKPTKTATDDHQKTRDVASQNQAEESGDETEEFVIDSIVAHKLTKSRRRRSAKKVEKLFRIPWYGYESDDDTWEPFRYFTRSKILTY